MTIPFQSAMSSSWTSWMIPNSACWPGLQQWNHHFYIFLPSWLAFFYVFLALNMEVGNQDLIAFFIGLVLVTEILRFGLEDMIDCCSAVPLILIDAWLTPAIEHTLNTQLDTHRIWMPGHYMIYTWKTVWTFFFCPLWVLPVTDVLFVQLRILVFDCEGLFKSFDNSNLDVPIKYQYFFNIMLKKKQ